MKVILCVLLMWTGINGILVAQTPLPTAGPSFSSKDTTTAAVIAVASMQAYPTGIDRQTTMVEAKEIVKIPKTTKTADQGPIRDWSNPPGYKGSRGPALSSSKHKPLTPKKYHRSKANRCYTF
jgi:hypothetical protein